MTEKKIDHLPSLYFPSEGNIDKELFQPVASNARTLDCMVGYFSSGVLSELALTMSSYLMINDAAPMRFIISPNVNESDFLAIRSAYESGADFFKILFPNLILTENSIRTYNVAALAYLIIEKRIELRIAVKRKGLFHVKVWLFETPDGGVAIHGSSNATSGGLFNNFEQMVLSRSWLSSESSGIVEILQEKFERIWKSELPGIDVIPLNKETIKSIENIVSIKPDILNIFKNNCVYASEEPEVYDVMSVQQLIIPEYLEYNTGIFSHQGEAVKAWFENRNNGILSIATGGGKTITSLIGATQLMNRDGKLFVVIAVPTKALMNQWESDVKEFSVVPVNTVGQSPSAIRVSVKSSLRKLRLNLTKAEVMIVTHNALLSGIFDQRFHQNGALNTLLVVDEVHNIGSANSQEMFPKNFTYQIGLSATYERQFDEVGTKFLLKVFDKVVYEYGLDRAIGECLVDYSYFAHFAYLTAEEEEQFSDLTIEIRKLSYAADGPSSPASERWQRLCLKRRALVESAKNKIKIMESLLPEDGRDIKKTLIFCTDKNPSQLEFVNSILIGKKIKFHQITAEETSNNKRLRNLIASFSNNELQVLTSKRVLDEGFNVPQTETAYLLASNTVARQWTQRLGRVLRLSPKTGKKSATIHDFIVIPLIDGEADKDLKALLESEYKRIHFFSKLSQNYTERNGGYEASQKLLNLLGVK